MAPFLTERFSSFPTPVRGEVDYHMTSTELKQRGVQLRVEIDQVCDDLVQRHSLGPQNFISELVTSYIPVGSSFGDARVILEAAGMKVIIKDYTPKNSSMVGWANLSDKLLFSNTEVAIDLSPKVPKDFSSGVGNVTALISYALP
jgi:hypothetical protein